MLVQSSTRGGRRNSVHTIQTHSGGETAIFLQFSLQQCSYNTNTLWRRSSNTSTVLTAAVFIQYKHTLEEKQQYFYSSHCSCVHTIQTHSGGEAAIVLQFSLQQCSYNTNTLRRRNSNTSTVLTAAVFIQYKHTLEEKQQYFYSSHCSCVHTIQTHSGGEAAILLQFLLQQCSYNTNTLWRRSSNTSTVLTAAVFIQYKHTLEEKQQYFYSSYCSSVHTIQTHSGGETAILLQFSLQLCSYNTNTLWRRSSNSSTVLTAAVFIRYKHTLEEKQQYFYSSHRSSVHTIQTHSGGEAAIFLQFSL